MNFLQKLDSFFNKIEESLDNPLPIKWIKHNDWVGIFKTDKNEYRISIKNYGNNIWRYKFYLYENNKLSVNLTEFDYDKFKVLSTVINSFNQFIDEINPDSIIFGAQSDSDSRIKLYSHFASTIKKKYGYQLLEKPKGNSKDVNPTLFILYKTDINKEILYKTIQNIIDEEI